ncbi:Putative transporter protein SLAC1/Mae1/ Ssu1/TehA [Septoria linicola]|uniref:Transporter protein SLAC1/Mae1/ Ssu1/TehA n=1 Tax=Septoria linicola TaxID=215465 RepID=A0A9Q9AK60_9PEZI|nr:putative transporter protein SLAC1/Mae1/ Ssu1/TehA [Septoria linicola]USW50824.1 Putative transporter protein SLAC1/Mae1/ Ssu1/TehA [Septoria linicola]
MTSSGHHEQSLWWRKWTSSQPSSRIPSGANSLNGDKVEKRLRNNNVKQDDGDVSFRNRLKHFTWAWFTFPMSTGGIALLLHATPHQFTGLATLGKIVYIFDIWIFLMLCAGISARFVMFPGTLIESLMHPTESLFFATFFLALINVVSCMQVYGVPTTGEWLVTTLRVLFWMYLATTFIVAVLQYLYLFSAGPGRLTIQSMTPGWILPIFPVMLSGTLASLIAPDQPVTYKLPIIVAGVTMQGLGWMVSFMVYAIYMHRLMQFGLPAPDLRPGMFIAVGPPSFTGLALIGMSQALPADSQYFMERPGMIMILQSVADFIAIFLWTLSFWFFSITVLSVLAGARRMSFHLVWWAFVFPNVGFTINTIRIGQQLESEGILWVASAMTILLVAMWIYVFFMHGRAVWQKQIMMPGMDEDKDAYKEGDRKANVPIPPDAHDHR